ncbi:MAG: hypothetical protein ACJ8AW_14825 [Rhodopila sp.]
MDLILCMKFWEIRHFRTAGSDVDCRKIDNVLSLDLVISNLSSIRDDCELIFCTRKTLCFQGADFGASLLISVTQDTSVQILRGAGRAG